MSYFMFKYLPARPAFNINRIIPEYEPEEGERRSLCFVLMKEIFSIEDGRIASQQDPDPV